MGGVSVYLWHRSQSLRRCLLLFRPLLCSLQDVLNQQTTTFYFWTKNNSRIHFFHLNANNIEASSPCVFAHGWRGSEFGTTLALGHSTKQHSVVNSDWLSMAGSSRRDGSVMENVRWYSAQTLKEFISKCNCLCVTLQSHSFDTDLLSFPLTVRNKLQSKHTRF